MTPTSFSGGNVEPVSQRIQRTLPRPARSEDLLPSEHRFVAAMLQLDFGRYESISVRCGELILDPWPATIRHLKFGAPKPDLQERAGEFKLHKSVAEFFEYVRSTLDGVIRILEVRHGLPFSMEIEQSTNTVR